MVDEAKLALVWATEIEATGIEAIGIETAKRISIFELLNAQTSVNETQIDEM